MKSLTTNSTLDNQYYCNFKFKFLKFDLSNHTTANCHAATPHEIDQVRLLARPGDLFNIPINVEERVEMLAGIPNQSCGQNCWPAESQGIESPRIHQNGPNFTHSTVHTQPEILELVLTKDCNYTCSYCCREFSTSWVRDLATHGNYDLPNFADEHRYSKATSDSNQLRQAALLTDSKYLELIEEAKLLARNVKRLTLTGGEPLLNNFLVDMIDAVDITTIDEIRIYTGLGASMDRLTRVIDGLNDKRDKIKFFISIENIGKYCEFNRYGSNWAKIEGMLDHLLKSDCEVVFRGTLTNLTIFGLFDFIEQFGQYPTEFVFSMNPDFMKVNVLDSDSKQHVQCNLHRLPVALRDRVQAAILSTPTEGEILSLRGFLKEFVARRQDLNLNIFPESFQNWIAE